MKNTSSLNEKKVIIGTIKNDEFIKKDSQINKIGILFKKYETVPLVFMFILGNDIEAVFVRQFIT